VPSECRGVDCTRLSLLRRIAQVLSRGHLRAAVWQEVFALLREEMGLHRGVLMMATADGGELVVEAAEDGEPARLATARYRRGEGISGRVLQTATAVVVPDVTKDPGFQGRIFGINQRSTAFVCVPIVVNDEAIGTLSVDAALDSQGHLEQTRCFLEILASMMSQLASLRRMMRLENAELVAENDRLRAELGGERPAAMIGGSDLMRDVFARIHRVAPSDTTVLIRGESGTGKELVASAIHEKSSRRGGAFVKVNCAALSENLLESELFGHEKGAFTGALNTRKGRLEEAEGGTLFLDEIGDFSPAVQVKLLRFVQEREFERVGSNRTQRADVRLIAATNRDLEKAVAEESFRADLYYRINVFPVLMPALRERRDDVMGLANHFVAVYSERLGKGVTRISTPAINMLMAYHWPGNVRELENCIEHAVLMAEDGVIHGHDLPPTLRLPEGPTSSLRGSLRESVELLEREVIADTLKQTEGNVTAAARLLALSPRMLRYKIKGLSIDMTLFRTGHRRKAVS
jgi:Nif-specific regulatory protein